MNKVTEENFLYEFYQVLNDTFHNKWASDRTDFEEDALFNLLLMNNGCAFSDDYFYSTKTLINVKDYEVTFVYGIKANEVNKFYDYIELYGMRRFVIFMDFFHGMYNEEPAPIIGRSVYFDAIKDIVYNFISTAIPCAAELFGSLSTTCASNNYRFAGVFIAAKIIDNLFGLSEDDVSMIKYEDLKSMLQNIGINLLLCGIKYME